MVFLFFFVFFCAFFVCFCKKVRSKKKQQTTRKHAKYSACKELIDICSNSKDSLLLLIISC